MKIEIKVRPECFPCFMKQAVLALRFGGADAAMSEAVLKAVGGGLKDVDMQNTPAHASTLMHRNIRATMGGDPFYGIKTEYTKKALELYPDLKKLVSESPDPLATSARLAIAGNVIDFGIFDSVDIEGTIARALEGPLGHDDIEDFREAVNRAKDVLFLLDNTGEAVFDRILIETLSEMGKKITAVAKGSPIINDATTDDALASGIGESAELSDNGSDAVGTIMEMCSSEFRKRFADADMVVSKGQGNFETLLDERREIFFLFQSKCEVVSEALGLTNGAMLLKKGPLL